MRYCSARCRQRASRWRRSQPKPPAWPWQAEGLTDPEKAVRFIETLMVQEGPRAGQPVTLAPFQRDWIAGTLAVDTMVSVLSIAR